jgi:hypothetical protein
MKSGLAIVIIGMGLTSAINPIFAYDNGPRVVGCDYRGNAMEKLKADSCFIPSSGMQMGQSWLIVRPGISNLYYRFEDNQGSIRNQSERLQKARIQTGPDYDSPINWQGSFIYRDGQCRPGGADAAVYELSNGTKICLYFNN